MDGSAIGGVLPVFGILITAFGTIIPCGKLQTLVPTVSEEGIFLLFLPIHFFFISPPLLFILELLVALLLLLTLPFIEENMRSHSGFRGFTHFNLTFRVVRLFLVNLLKCDLSSGIN
jgi:hypothetical protein